jgi:phosphate-selective porin OprO and OprP
LAVRTTARHVGNVFASSQQGSPFRQSTLAAGWDDGFVIQSGDGDFRLQFGLLMQVDGRFALEDVNDAVVGTFAVRRLRPSLKGRVLRRFEFILNPDFGGGSVTIVDAYLETRISNAFRVRVGKSKVPLGLERLQGGGDQLFFERAFPTAIAPNRDVGVQVLGDLAGNVVSYAGGVMNTAPDGGGTDLDTTDNKDIAGRIAVRPFGRTPEGPLAGLGVAIAGTRGRPTSLPAFSTVLLQQPFLSYSGASGDGIRTRYSPQVSYYHGAFGGFAEYVHSSQVIRRGAVSADVAHTAWQVAGSWVITGEDATDRGVRPRSDFNTGQGGSGAVQIAARYHRLSVDEQAITRGLAVAGSSRLAQAMTVGVNWYLNPHVRYVLNLERTVFDANPEGPRPPEKAIVFRVQLSF